MTIIRLTLFVCVLFVLNEKKTNGLTGHICSYQTRSKYYRQTCDCLWCWCKKTVSAYRMETKYKCCAGWTEDNTGCCCDAICEHPCKNNGTCVAPNTCSCLEGNTGLRCENPICKTACFNKGYCVAPEKCNCDVHWTDDHCTTPICSPPCSKGGVCINPNKCRYVGDKDSAKDCIGKSFDVSFVLDTSGSIGYENFQRMKQFIKNVVNILDISSAMTRISLIEFGTIPTVDFKLDEYVNRTDLLEAIDNASYIGGATFTSDALETMRKEGFSGGRLAAPDVGILLTDGFSKFPSVTAAQADLAKQSGISMIAIGIGQHASHFELSSIASGQTRLFEVADFQKLLTIAGDVARTICAVEFPKGYKPKTTTVYTTAEVCSDKDEHCSSYPRDSCSDFKEYSMAHCPKFCGFCGNFTNAICKNNIDDCDQYAKEMCLDSTYTSWAIDNCAEYCGYCANKTDVTPMPKVESTSTKSVTEPIVCEDKIKNCGEYGGQSVCTNPSFKLWSKTNCPKYCGVCYVLHHYDAEERGSLRCPTWDLPEECSLEIKDTSCCPLPVCPSNFRLTIKRR